MLTKPELTGQAFNFHVACGTENSPALEVTVCQLSRHRIVLQVHTPEVVIRTSQMLKDFRVSLGTELLYSGRATVTSAVDTGTSLVCEAKLEDAWVDYKSQPGSPSASVPGALSKFMAESLRNRVSAEFKVAVADLQMLLHDLQHWTNQVALQVMAEPSGSRRELERELVLQMCSEAFPALTGCFERFEFYSQTIDPEVVPSYASYVKRQLHPLVLCAPFMYRTYRKPLGYAGDYEMVSMMLRDPLEGSSPFAKVLNTFFLSTPPVKAHQNRILELKRMLQNELLCAQAHGRRLRVLNIGCGPAREIQDLITTTSLTNAVDFTLIDFNQETLDHTERLLKGLIQVHGRTTHIHLLRRSVAQTLKEAARSERGVATSSYDVVYCAGLFDYLPKQVCRHLLTLSYHLLNPGGLLLATNVDSYNPSRNWMELAVDWHLIYRNAHEMQELLPKEAPLDGCRVFSEASGVNVFLEARKPRNG